MLPPFLTAENNYQLKSSYFKRIDDGDLTVTDRLVYKNHTLDSSSINNYKFSAESSSVSSEGSYYNSLKTNFYLSGSDYSQTESRFNMPFCMHTHYNPRNPIHMKKFHKYKEGHFYSIPQQYFGQYIKPGSFTLYESSSGKYEITIKDDKFGNLYAFNAEVSHSGATSISSSENYVGNIFYETGIAVINESSSYWHIDSSSVNYASLGTDFSMSFQAAKDIYVSEYNVVIEPGEFNKTNNWSAKAGIEGASAGYLHQDLTSSYWTPYFNTIGFYDDEGRCVMKARYPQNIKTRRDISLILKVKMDW